MATLGDAQIAAAAKAAGIPADEIATAVAIALAESGGNPRAHNKVPPDNSYGLWQINMLGNLGPARRKQFGISSNEALFDPAVNAKAMAAISNRGKSWTAWTTYTRGTYRMYLNRGKAVAGGSGVTVPAGVSNSKIGSLSDLGDKLTNPVTWWKMGMNLSGFLLILVGALLLTGKSLASVVPVGKVAKAVKAVK